MGHIPEPKGVDFLIESSPLTNKERKELSEFIKERKSKLANKPEQRKKNPIQEKPKA